MDLKKFATETRNPNSMNLDAMSALEIVTLMNREDRNVCLAIEAEAGPEVLTGSTRLKAGTTQKMILNMITTASMVRSGKAYQNLMVDVVQSCDKLCVRIENIVMDATGVNREEARAAIDEANQSAKVAITKILTGTDVETAKELLKQAKGHVRVAIQLAQSK